ncbi:MAG: hypothetical protein IKU55_03005 [Clostridia bacterium]|nr:hypothetical protein [Clostridia bacterium]
MKKANTTKNTAALYYRANVGTTVGLLVVFTIVFLTMLFTAYYLLGMIMLGVLYVVWVPSTIYYAIQWRRYAKLKLTHIQYAVPEKAVTKAMKKNFGFQVEMKIGGEVRTLKTRPVFNETKKSPLYGPLFYHQKVQVGLDEARGEAVIIRRK